MLVDLTIFHTKLASLASPKVPGTNGDTETETVAKSAWHQWRRCQATEHQRRRQKCLAPMGTLRLKLGVVPFGRRLFLRPKKGEKTIEYQRK